MIGIDQLDITFDQILLGIAVLLLLSVISSRASGRLGVPALLLFLVIGMLAGSEGIGGIEFDDPALAQSTGVIALIFILFSGGVDTVWARVRAVLAPSLVLSTVGVLATATLVGLFVLFILDFPWYTALLLGAIVSSTDAAAVFAVLRSKGVSLRGNLQSMIELESGSNDPMAIFLTAAMIALITNQMTSVWEIVLFFFQQMLLGAVAGYLFGRMIVYVINHFRVDYDGLYPVLSIALVLLTYGLTELMRGNGFLAVYVAGLVVGNSETIHRRSLMRFHDGLAWLMQIVMFLALGLLVFPSQLLAVVGTGRLASTFLILVARPASVALALLPFRVNIRKIGLVGWVGLRGAVPIILATFPLLANVPRANEIFNIVFFIVLTSVLIQGSTIPLIARWLRVDAPLKPRRVVPLEFEPTVDMAASLLEIELLPGASAVGKRIINLGLPKGVLLALIGRENTYFVPTGGSMLEAGDTLLILSDSLNHDELDSTLNAQNSA